MSGMLDRIDGRAAKGRSVLFQQVDSGDQRVLLVLSQLSFEPATEDLGVQHLPHSTVIPPTEYSVNGVAASAVLGSEKRGDKRVTSPDLSSLVTPPLRL